MLDATTNDKRVLLIIECCLQFLVKNIHHGDDFVKHWISGGRNIVCCIVKYLFGELVWIKSCYE